MLVRIIALCGFVKPYIFYKFKAFIVKYKLSYFVGNGFFNLFLNYNIIRVFFRIAVNGIVIKL